MPWAPGEASDGLQAKLCSREREEDHARGNRLPRCWGAGSGSLPVFLSTTLTAARGRNFRAGCGYVLA
jgi:hypothetical protein